MSLLYCLLTTHTRVAITPSPLVNTLQYRLVGLLVLYNVGFLRFVGLAHGELPCATRHRGVDACFLSMSWSSVLPYMLLFCCFPRGLNNPFQKVSTFFCSTRSSRSSRFSMCFDISNRSKEYNAACLTTSASSGDSSVISEFLLDCGNDFLCLRLTRFHDLEHIYERHDVAVQRFHSPQCVFKNFGLSSVVTFGAFLCTLYGPFGQQ